MTERKREKSRKRGREGGDRDGGGERPCILYILIVIN